MRLGLFEEAWGTNLRVDDIGQTQVDRFAHLRLAGKLTPDHSRGRKEVRAGTVDGDFRWLSSVFNWGRKHRVDGKRLLPVNPLHDVEWTKEKNVRRPIASHDRFVKTLEQADAIDPHGRLPCILTLARHTGHRENAICQLRADDYLRTKADVRTALSELGLDERSAEQFDQGGIRWRAEADKQGRYSVTPIRKDVRDALDQYLRENPRVGDVPLFPSPQDETRPIRRDLVATWLLKAEKLAKLPKIGGGLFHPYRRLWATERKHIPIQDVAEAGGWKSIETVQQLYQQSDAEGVRRAIDG